MVFLWEGILFPCATTANRFNRYFKLPIQMRLTQFFGYRFMIFLAMCGRFFGLKLDLVWGSISITQLFHWDEENNLRAFRSCQNYLIKYLLLRKVWHIIPWNFQVFYIKLWTKLSKKLHYKYSKIYYEISVLFKENWQCLRVYTKFLLSMPVFVIEDL